MYARIILCLFLHSWSWLKTLSAPLDAFWRKVFLADTPFFPQFWVMCTPCVLIVQHWLRLRTKRRRRTWGASAFVAAKGAVGGNISMKVHDVSGMVVYLCDEKRVCIKVCRVFFLQVECMSRKLLLRRYRFFQDFTRYDGTAPATLSCLSPGLVPLPICVPLSTLLIPDKWPLLVGKAQKILLLFAFLTKIKKWPGDTQWKGGENNMHIIINLILQIIWQTRHTHPGCWSAADTLTLAFLN